MRFSRLAYATILALIAALAVPFGAAGAETTGSLGVVAARAAAEQQLIALGIDPSDAVFQIGARNYAGANCPGSGWNCTSATKVVQIGAGTALTGTNNYAECSINDCAIFQPAPANPGGGTNEARCEQETSGDGATQSCTISQTNTSGTNKAFVNQTIRQSKPRGSQDAGQLVTVNQSNGTGANHSSIAQTIAQVQAFDLSGDGNVAQPNDVAQSQEAHQRADVCQGGGTNPCNASSSGTNASNLTQSNVQRATVNFGSVSSGTTIMQKQNTERNTVLRTSKGRAFAAAPKSTAIVFQNSGGHTNNSSLLHFNRQVASVLGGKEGAEGSGDARGEGSDEEIRFAPAFGGSVVQQQGISGNPVCPNGGLCGYVTQDSTGVQRAHERQDELQKVQGPPGAIQSQYGPEFCCATQTGANPHNVNTIDQVKVQLHTGTITDGKIQAHCESSPDGCDVQQTLRQNDMTTTNSCTGPECNPTIFCTTGTEGGCPGAGTAPGPLRQPCDSPRNSCVTRITVAPHFLQEISATV